MFVVRHIAVGVVEMSAIFFRLATSHQPRKRLIICRKPGRRDLLQEFHYAATLVQLVIADTGRIINTSNRSTDIR